MSRITVIIPVVRPQNLPGLVESIKANHGLPDGEVEILYAEDTARIGCPKMVKALTDMAQTELVCFLGDDSDPQKDFLKIALQIMEESDLWLVGFNDGHSRKATHWLASKKLLNGRGEFFDTDYFHNFVDDELRVRAERLGKYGWSPQAMVGHKHPTYGSAPVDEHYARVMDRDRWTHDEELFRERCCKLSVALIVKDEEAMLGRCLESVKDADEIVIVDTGSTDGTKKLALEYTDKVFDFPWSDHFSDARNFALDKCTNDWVLSIDADEFLEEGGIRKLRRHLTTGRDAVGILMRSPGNEYHVPRCFRRTPLIRWVGRIHETVNTRDYDKTDVAITFTSSPAHSLDPDRNLRMLEKAVAEDPENTRYLYYLAREYGYRRFWAKCEATFEKYLTLSKWLPERADAYFMLALAYWYDQKGDLARQACLNALNINANIKVAALLMADMSWEKNGVQWRKLAESADDSDCLFIRKNHLVF